MSCECGCEEEYYHEGEVKWWIQEIDKKCIEAERQATIYHLAGRVPLLAKSDIVDFPYLPSTVMRATMNYEKFKQAEGGHTKPEVIEATSLDIHDWADAKIHATSLDIHDWADAKIHTTTTGPMQRYAMRRLAACLNNMSKIRRTKAQASTTHTFEVPALKVASDIVKDSKRREGEGRQ